MTFARNKSLKKSNAKPLLPPFPSKAMNFFSSAPFSLSLPKSLPLSDSQLGYNPINSRLEMIETNLRRVANQHEALMPLIGMKEQLSAVQKAELQLKGYQIRINENQRKLKNLTGELKNVHLNYENSFEKIVGQRKEKSTEGQILEKTLKGTNNLINALQSNLKDVESTVLNFQRVTDSKFKELEINVQKKVETRVDKNLEDIKKIMGEFENYIQNNFKERLKVLGELYPNQVLFFLLIFVLFI